MMNSSSSFPSTRLSLARFLLVTIVVAAVAAVKLPDHRELQAQVTQGGVLTDTVDLKLRSTVENEQEALALVQSIAQEAHCDAPRHIFRPSTNPEVAARHKAFGLHLHFRMNCASAATATAATSSATTQPGQGAQAAVHSLSEALTNDPQRYSQLESVEVEPEIMEMVIPGSTRPLDPNQAPPKRAQRHQGRDSRFLVQSNDPLLSFQDHYDTIHLFEAWETMNDEDAWSNAPNVVVQVLDSGLDLLHEDLSTNVWVNDDEICGGNNGVDDDNNQYINDCHGYNHADNVGWPKSSLLGSSDHGSHCAGTIAATTGNGVGLAGVAGGFNGNQPGISLMTSTGFGQTDTDGFEDALVYGADNGAHISSNSWGYTSPNNFPTATRDAIDYAVNNGVIVVFAAGNDNSNANYYPGRYDQVIAVAATEQQSGVRAGFSNYGSWVDIAAPGVDVASTSYANSYVYKSGTSMACPHVSGALALAKALRFDATNDQLKDCMYDTSTDINPENPSYQNQLGSGLLNAEAFLECVLALDGGGGGGNNTPQPTTSPVTASPTSSPEALCGGSDGSCGGSCGNCQAERGANQAGCSCDACECLVCATDGFCCNNRWDALCAQAARQKCACAQNYCGDGQVTGEEVCDSGAFGPGVVSTCREAGFDVEGGELGCSDDCGSIETLRCRKVIHEISGLSGERGNVYRDSVSIEYPTEFIRFEMTGTGDADLYVRIGSPPSNSLFNCRPYLTGSAEACVGEGGDNAAAVYHYMIVAYTDYSDVTLTVVTDGIDAGSVTLSPTVSPTASPTSSPTLTTTSPPSVSPTNPPSTQPTRTPSASPSLRPTVSPSRTPTTTPTKAPSTTPTSAPTTELERCTADCASNDISMSNSLGVSDPDFEAWCEAKCSCEEAVSNLFPEYLNDFDKILLSCRCAAASNHMALNLVQCGNCVPACQDMFGGAAWCEEACTETYENCGVSASFAGCVTQEFCDAASGAGDENNPGFGASSGVYCAVDLSN